MDDLERSSPIQIIQPVSKIRAQIYDRDRRELRHPYERNPRKKVIKRRKPSINRTENLVTDACTPEEIELDFLEYKADLKTRVTFDRAQILPEETSFD